MDDCSHNEIHNGIYSISISQNELVITLIEDVCTHFSDWFVGIYEKVIP